MESGKSLMCYLRVAITSGQSHDWSSTQGSGSRTKHKAGGIGNEGRIGYLDRQIERQADRQADMQTDIQTDVQADR